MPNPLYHIGTSAIIGVTSYALTNSLPIAVGTFVIGWVIDADHVVDYVFGEKTELGVADPHYYAKQTKLRKIFHAWEWLIPLWILAISFHQEVAGIWLSISALWHIMFDQIYWKKSRWYFFLIYRIMKGFAPNA